MKRFSLNQRSLKLVIFDLDKTITSCNVSFAFGKFLYNRGELSFSRMLSLVGAYFLQKWGFCSLKYLHTLAFKHIFQGQKKERIAQQAADFLAEQNDSFFQKTLIERLKEYQKENIPIWIQSSSPIVLVAPIAARCGVWQVSATTYKIDSEEKFSHIEVIVDGTVKEKLFLRYIQKQGIEQEETAFYSDSMQDLPLLESVGVPIVVSGDKKLMKIARKRAWQIL